MDRAVRLITTVSLWSLGVCAVARGVAPITVEVDARDAARHVFHTRLRIPARPGAATLLFPQWLPGMHTPAGLVRDMAGLHISAAGKPVAWQRDPADMFTFHCQVPDGAETLDVQFDFLPEPGRSGHSTSATAKLATLSWDTVLLYPQGQKAADIQYVPRVLLPAGWKFGTALPIETSREDVIQFKPVSLETLIDSPLIAGEYLKVVPLATELALHHEIDMVSDSAAALEIDADKIEAYSRMVREAHRLFGVPHFREYHFLLTLSDSVGFGGLEHHECSDNRGSEQTFTDPDRFEASAGLLPHEFVHSWNGKHRRPAGMATASYQEPMKDELLWIYEGLTTYLGTVLTARSGLLSPDQSRLFLAHIAAALEHTPGRSWRSLADTAASAPLIFGGPDEWQSYRRGRDFYPEGALIWLEVDVTLRQKSRGRISIDDFCRRFFGGDAGGPSVKPYELEDVIAVLNDLVPNDWTGFFRERVQQTTTHPPLGGITSGGWRLIYAETPSESFKAQQKKGKLTADLGASLGLLLGDNDTVQDAILDMPAVQAGLAPGMKLVAVNGRKFSTERLLAAVKASKTSDQPIELTADNHGFMSTFRIDYHGGARYPELARDDSRPDLLSEILKPHVASTAPSGDPVDTLINDQMAALHIPGLSLAVVKNGKIIKAAGYGMANIEWNQPATPETVYQIQSITKTFTATAIMMLVEQGKIDLNANVGTYLEGTPESWKNITIHHLLSHTSGIKDFINEPTQSLRLDVTEQEVFNATVPRELNFQPGDKYAYSNTNFHLLAMIIRKLTGQFYGDYLRDHIFEPLGMSHTAIISWSEIIPNRAAGYIWERNQMRNGDYIAPSVLGYGGGGIRSTVLDLAKWDAALYTEQLVKKKTLEQMWTPARFNNGQLGNYGFGWGVYRNKGHRYVGHTGAHATGFSTAILRYLDDGLTVIVFINRRNVDATAIGNRVVGNYIPELAVPIARPTR